MEAIELIARFGLAAVFAVAGIAKLADLQGSRQALTGFGVPERLTGVGGIALPLAELAVAVLLIPASTAFAGALGALVLLLCFCAGIVRSMARGESPDCHCFGQLHSEPVGWPTLIRNLLLAAVAGVALAFALDGESAAPFAWIADFGDAGIVALASALALAAVVLVGRSLFEQLLHQNGRLLLRVDALERALAQRGIPVEPVDGAAGAAGLPVGSPAPDFTLSGLHGETTTLEALLAPERPAVLVFTDPGCGPCSALLPQVTAWQRDLDGELTVALIGRGSLDDNRARAKEHGVDRVFVEERTEVSEAYDAVATPSAVLVRADGTIGSPVSSGDQAIRALVASAASTHAIEVVPGGPPAPPRPAIGDPAPDFELPDLDGENVSLEGLRGERLLVLFWDPGCGFCSRMLPDLRAWERDAGDDAPRPLLISRGTVEDNRALGLDATVLLDQRAATVGAFGATGTPSAILVDADGAIASELGVGAPACLALAEAKPEPA